MKIEHPDYQVMRPLWDKVRDVVYGEEVVKSAGTKYLPMLTSQAEANDIYARRDYENYLMRACFYGAASRTVMGLVGAVLRKEPTVEGVPDNDLLTIQDAIGVDYEGLDSLVLAQLSDAVSVGRYALLLDKGAEMDEYPYVAKFRAEDIVAWTKSVREGRSKVDTIVLRQDYEEPDTEDPVGVRRQVKSEYLVLRLGKVPDYVEGIDGAEGFAGASLEENIYWQEFWRIETDKKNQTSKMNLDRVRVPTMNGGRFWDEIPCDIVNAIGGIRCEVENPPMLALANVILAHYRGSADLEWGRHMTAIPQPWVAGANLEEGDKLVVGCGYAWNIPDPAGKVAYLEFTGAGLGHIAEGLKDKERMAAVLGARMLEEQPSGVEAMGTVRLRQAGDRSVLATIAHNVSEAMTRAIQRWLRWQSPTWDNSDALREVRFALSSDFEGARMDPAELTALTQALQQGTISWETFSHNLRKGEMLPEGVTDEEERERIQIGAPGRSRKDELAQLQMDVREGRISRETYLEQIQTLGMLPGVDLATEADRIYEEKVISAELQMQSFMQAGANLGQPGASSADGGTFGSLPPPAEDEEEETVPPDDEDEEEDQA